jgi:hypothetical protein
MSTSGLTQQFLPSTLDGLVIINADEISIGGNPIDIDTLVPYTGANKPVDVGVQPIRTNYAPVADADVVNLLTLQNAVAYIEGINVANFVKYTGSNDNVDLSTYTISSSTAPSTGNNLTNKTYVDTQDNAVANFASATYVGYTNSFQDVDLTLVGNNSLKGYNLTATNKVIAPTAQFTGITSAAPVLALGVDGSGNLNTFAVPSGASFPFTGTTNINGGLQTLQNATQFNPSLDANSYFVTGVFPTTYVFSTNWITNPVSGTEANIALDPAVFYFDTAHKYVISFTGIYGTGATWVGTVFNNSTSLTVSDASIAITTTPQNLSMTFTTGSSNPTIYLRFVGASGTLRWTNFTIKEVDVEIMGNLLLSSEIDSNIVLSNGRTANLANGLKVNQTSVATAPSLTTASLPAGVAASTLSGTYSLTATGGGTTFGMWLGSSFTYLAGAKYTYTFTGFSTNATATQAMIIYTNTYTGGSGTLIGDYIVNVPITSSTVSGTFTATSNNNVVWNFVSSAAGRSVSFATFTLTRADTQITGIASLPTNTGTIVAGLGLNASNQIVSYSASGNPNFSAVTVGSVPYESAVDTFSNSLITQGTISLGYNGGSFTASTGIGSITYSAPTYTANSNASFQGIINLSTLPNYALNTACIATFIGLSFPLFAVAPYPYFTLTCGATVVYTSATGASGTITMPFTPTSTTLFITIYFKAPGTGVSVPVLSWTNFTISTPSMTTTGTSLVNGIASVNGGTNFANINGYMQTGSLTIGDPTRNYGGGTTTWNNNTAGLLFECLDNTEIAVHDAGARVASLMYYDGASGNITMGRNMGWGVSNIATAGNLFVPAIGIIEKTGGNSGANYFRIVGNDLGSSPYLEYFFNNQRRMYIGNTTATEAQIATENGAQLAFLTGGASRMTITAGGDTSTTGKLTVQDVVRFGNYAGGNYDNIQFMRGTGSGQYPNIRCQENYIAMYVSDAGGWVSDSQVGDLVIRVNAGENIRFSTGSSSSLTIDTNGNVGVGRNPSYKLDVNGAMHVRFDANADDSKTVYGPNATWSAFLTVGSGQDNSGPATAQVLSTNGNLHLDAGNSLDMYYGYYPSSRGTPNTHRFYGSGIYFASGLPQQDTTAIAPICFNGSQLFRSANINHIAYSNNNVSWSGGVNITYAFYRTNGYVSTSIHGKFSYYVGGAGMAYPAMRIYSQTSGLYYYYDLQAYTNVTYNHVTFPFEVLFTSNNATTVGWFDVYFYQNGGVITDGNDQLWVTCNTSMTNQFV